MLSVSPLSWLVCFSCVAVARGLRAVGDHVITHKDSDRPHHGLPRLDEAGVEDLVALQASGSVTSVDLVHVSDSRLSPTDRGILISKGIH